MYLVNFKGVECAAIFTVVMRKKALQYFHFGKRIEMMVMSLMLMGKRASYPLGGNTCGEISLDREGGCVHGDYR